MKKYRLITRSDFDGLVCAMIMKELDILDDILFVHPKDMQDHMIDVGENDITANVPFAKGVHLAFDHHSSQSDDVHPNYINKPDYPSAARVVYEYYGGEKNIKLSKEILEAVDKADSAGYTMEEIINPQGWILLSFIMDPRSGFGRFRDFRISNYDLMMLLIDYVKDHSLEEVLQQYDVKERIEMYFEQQKLFKQQLLDCSEVIGTTVLLRLKQVGEIYVGNRFLIYTLFPQCQVSIHEMWGLKKRNTVYALGKSIFNKDSDKDLGAICKKHGGGGHKNAATCQVPNGIAQHVLEEILEDLNK